MSLQSAALEQQLTDKLVSLRYDPLGFVLWAYPWGEKGTPLEKWAGPQDWQVEQLLKIGAAVKKSQKFQSSRASGKGIGKEQPKSLKILTISGFRSWGDIKPGDLVFAEDGTNTRVVQRHEQGVRRVAKVIFDDGSETRCGYEHLWKVMGRKERRNDKGAIRVGNWTVMSTQEMLDKGLRFGGKLNARQFEIPTQGPVHLSIAQQPFDPYFMGMWLGDGTRGKAEFHKPYPEPADELERRGLTISRTGKGTVRLLGVNAQFSKLEVSHCHSYQKYVPDEYKIASIEQRTDVLCGLLDSDGECASHGSIIFNSTSKRLVEDVIWLARSLGGKAQMQPVVKDGKYRNEDGELVRCRGCWRATLALPFNPFRIAHKAANWHMPEARYFKRWIDRIEPDGEEECMCISIEHPSHCYQANDFIVTHNSAQVCWVSQWAMCTRLNTRGVITAGTEPQLRTKTMPEFAKWYQLLICKHWFVNTATSFYAADPELAGTWRLDAIPWNENNPEAFAGLHNLGNRIVAIFDEASQIATPIWDTTDGIMTDADTEVVWCDYGNPTRGEGRFYENHHSRSHRIDAKSIDSRDVAITDKAKLKEQVDDYGEDSDYVRMMIRGLFPRASSMQFIAHDIVANARKRDVHVPLDEPLIMGVDCARFGDDETVIAFRKGRDARIIPWKRWRGIRDVNDSTDIIAFIADAIRAYHVDAVFIDGGNVGGPIIDGLRKLGFGQVTEVMFGKAADRVNFATDATRYANKRSEMWGNMKVGLNGLAIPDDDDLETELTSVFYGFRETAKGTEVMLERKEHMRERGVKSPDAADALALTYAYPVMPRKRAEDAGGPLEMYQGHGVHQGSAARNDYDPLSALAQE